MADHLQRFLEGARARVAAACATEPLAELRARAPMTAMPPPSLRDALSGPGVAVIAEIKRASPSRGELAAGLSALQQAAMYRAGGAAAISVLTEPDHFRGSLEDLRRVAALRVPTLRKDFVVDPYQVWEARTAGAAAVLVIATAVDDAQLSTLLEACAEAEVEALVEVHDTDEAQRAVAAGADLIGINARDLRTFEVDRATFGRVYPTLPRSVVTVDESGITGPDEVRRAADAGADAVLVGEALVTADDPTAAVTALVEAGRAAATGSGR